MVKCAAWECISPTIDDIWSTVLPLLEWFTSRQMLIASRVINNQHQLSEQGFPDHVSHNIDDHVKAAKSLYGWKKCIDDILAGSCKTPVSGFENRTDQDLPMQDEQPVPVCII